MAYVCRITVIKCDFDAELQRKYLGGEVTGPCTDFTPGQIFEITAENYHTFPTQDFCSTAWDSVKDAVEKALKGLPFMDYWSFDVSKVVSCCKDGLKPVVFEISREETAQ